MGRLRILLSLAFLFTLALAVRADDGPFDGNWKLSYFTSPSAGITNWIVKLDTADGKLAGKLVVTNPRMRDASLVKAEVIGKQVRLVFKTGSDETVFEGSLAGDDKNKIIGTFDDDRRVYIAHLERTEATSLAAADALARRELPEPMQKAMALSAKPNQLLLRAQQAQSPDEKIKLAQQAIDATKEMQADLTKLYQEVVSNHAGDMAAFDAVQNLIRDAAKNNGNAEQIRKWASAAAEAAKRYGPAWERETALQIAQSLLAHKELTPIALDQAQRAATFVKDGDPASKQRRVLKLLANLEQQAGKTDALRQTEARLEKVEQILDKEYATKIPPLKVEAFGGRKNSSDRAVVMELFTGAECPPCVAADVAFDALAKAYKPSELILLQHHLHIPGSDPLTNPDTVARMSYYQKKFPEVRGTPSTLFNGKPGAGGGGPLTNAGNKLKEYREIIDPILEEPAAAKLRATAVFSGDKVNIKVDVTETKQPNDDWRLCVAVVEDNVRYQGGNRLRFHHYVVRAMPTGAEGVPLPEKGKPYTATVDVNELRTKLAKYLDEHHTTRPFPNTDRPMEFKNFRVVAFIQDDKSKQIVQGTVVDLAGQSARR